MPIDNGIVYSDYNSGLNTGHGISWYEVARLLGTIPDEATMCCSEKVNGLSRYRPVKWDTPKSANMDSIETHHSSRLYWMENTAVGTPWIYGQGFDDGYRTIVAPAINMTFDQLVDASGNLSSAAKWIFNRPAMTEFVHFDHFHGYNHKAKPSIFGRVEGGLENGNLSRLLGTVYVGLKPQKSTYSGYTDGYYALRKEDGCWAPHELLKIINFPTTAYVGVAVRNRNVTAQSGNRWRYSIGTAGVIHPNTTLGSGANATWVIDMMDQHILGNFYFKLEMEYAQNAFSTPNARGIYMEVRTNDVLDVVVFLSDTAITSSHSMTPPTITGRSLFINNDYKPIRTFKIVESTATYTQVAVDYQWSLSYPVQISNDIINLSDTLYFRHGSDVYGFEAIFKRVRLQQNAIVVTASSEANASGRLTDVTIETEYRMQDGDFFTLSTGTQRVNFGSLNGTYRASWEPSGLQVYQSFNDAKFDNTSAAINLTDYLKNVVGMSDTEISNNAGYLPFVVEGYNCNDPYNPVQISASISKLLIRVSCNPTWTVNEEFYYKQYKGVATYSGNEGNRTIWNEFD